MISPRVSFKNLSSVENLLLIGHDWEGRGCGKTTEMASLRLYPILLSTEVPPLPAQYIPSEFHFHPVVRPPSLLGVLNIERSSLQQAGRGLEASVLLRFCRWVFGLPLQSLLLLIHSRLVGAYGSEFGQEWFLPL